MCLVIGRLSTKVTRVKFLIFQQASSGYSTWWLLQNSQKQQEECLGDSVVKRPASAQVMISRLVSLSLTLGSVLTAQSLEPVSVSPSLSAPPLLTLCLSLSKN